MQCIFKTYTSWLLNSHLIASTCVVIYWQKCFFFQFVHIQFEDVEHLKTSTFAFKFTNDNRCKHRLSSLMSYFSLFLFQQAFIHMDGEKNIICLHYGLWHSSISFERKAQGPFYGNTFPGSARTIWCHQRNSNEGETSERVAKIVKDAISLLYVVYIDTEQLYEMQIVRHNVFINNRLYIRI